MMRFLCPSCRQPVTLGEDQANTVVTCPACGSAMRVPAVPAAPPAGQAAALPPPLPPPLPPVEPLDELEVVEPPHATESQDQRSSQGYAKPISSLLGPTWLPDIRRQKGEPVTPALDRLPLEPLPADCPPEADALGEPLATLQHRTLNRLLLLIGGLLLMLVGFILVVVLISLPPEPRQPGRRNSGPGALIVLSICGIGGGIWMAVVGVRGVVKYARQKLWLCPGGVVLQGRGSSEWFSWDRFPPFWCQVTKTDHYTNGAYTGTTWTYFFEIEDQDGHRQRFDSKEYGWAVKAIGDRIQRESSSALFLVYNQRLDAGRPVDFPPFGMTAKGLEHKDAFIPWRELSDMVIEAGTLKLIDCDGRTWAKESLGKIAHSLLFLALLDRRLPPRR